MTLLVMGVSGCGKSTVAEALARALGGVFLDADPFHPAANVDKMRRGIPLTDEDRAGWLASLADELQARDRGGTLVVLACSALKQAYRERLRVVPDLRVVYLHGSRAVLQARLEGRSGHFMGPALLDTQLATLEPPVDAPGLPVLRLDIGDPPDLLVERVLDRWFRRPGGDT